MSVQYVVLTCRRNQDLTDAALATCLKDQAVRVYTDVDDLDAKLRLQSISRKLLRAIQDPMTWADWFMVLDSDTWVNTCALQRVVPSLIVTGKHAAGS